MSERERHSDLIKLNANCAIVKSILLFCDIYSIGIVTDSNAYDQSKRLRTGGDYSHSAYTTPSPFHPPPAPVWGPHG